MNARWMIKYFLECALYHSMGYRILVTDVYRQRFGDITPKEAIKESGHADDEFLEDWREINGSWEPKEVVWVYEFKHPRNCII